MRYHVKKRWTLIATLFLLAGAGLFFWFCIYDLNDDGYEDLKERVKAQMQDQDAPRHASQKKLNVSKQFWLARNGQRLFFRLDAQEGVLVYEKDATAQRLVEEMHRVKGSFQKKQELYVFEAKQARYDHQEEDLIAEELVVHLYRLEGDVLPDHFDPAEPQMVFSAKKGAFQGDKMQLQGSVSVKSAADWSLLCDEISYDGAGIFLNGDVLLEIPEKQTKIFTEKAWVQRQNIKSAPEKIFLEGDVRLMRREGKLLQYLLADEATYEPSSEKMHFYAHGSHRVLLHDKINNLEVTAPEIVMYRDEAKKMQFKGIGDVKFRFAEEEYEKMKKRFLFEKDSADGT